MPVYLLNIYILKGYHYARLFHMTKFVIDKSAEGLHGGRKVHVSIYKWRNGLTKISDLPLEDFIIILVPAACEKLLHLLLVKVYL